jgi:hypothetical protein
VPLRKERSRWGAAFFRFAEIDVPLEFYAEPGNQTVDVGSSAFLSAGVHGSEPLSCQWKFNGHDIAGAIGDIYVISSTTTNDAGVYSIVVTNASGVITSSNALLTVTLPSFQALTRISNGLVQLRFTGSPSTYYWIERTTNLVDWTPLTNLFSTNGILDFVDRSATNLEKGFYRTRR